MYAIRMRQAIVFYLVVRWLLLQTDMVVQPALIVISAQGSLSRWRAAFWSALLFNTTERILKPFTSERRCYRQALCRRGNRR